MGWVTRTATLVLVVLLGGGPTLAAVCDAMCVAPPVSVITTESAAPHHGHQQHASVAHHRAAKDEHAAHAEHQAIPATFAAGEAHASRWLGQDCCRQLVTPRVPLAVSRPDNDILPGSHAALLHVAALVWIADAHPFGPAHGPPPGEMPPGRAPLVLRI